MDFEETIFVKDGGDIVNSMHEWMNQTLYDNLDWYENLKRKIYTRDDPLDFKNDGEAINNYLISLLYIIAVVSQTANGLVNIYKNIADGKTEDIDLRRTIPLLLNADNQIIRSINEIIPRIEIPKDEDGDPLFELPPQWEELRAELYKPDLPELTDNFWKRFRGDIRDRILLRVPEGAKREAYKKWLETEGLITVEQVKRVFNENTLWSTLELPLVLRERNDKTLGGEKFKLSNAVDNKAMLMKQIVNVSMLNKHIKMPFTDMTDPGVEVRGRDLLHADESEYNKKEKERYGIVGGKRNKRRTRKKRRKSRKKSRKIKRKTKGKRRKGRKRKTRKSRK